MAPQACIDASKNNWKGLPMTPAGPPDLTKIGLMVLPDGFKPNFFQKLNYYCNIPHCSSPAQTPTKDGCLPDLTPSMLPPPKSALSGMTTSNVAARLGVKGDALVDVPPETIKIVIAGLDIWKIVAFSGSGFALLLLIVLILVLVNRH